jgi:hypothetical protein
VRDAWKRFLWVVLECAIRLLPVLTAWLVIRLQA